MAVSALERLSLHSAHERRTLDLKIFPLIDYSHFCSTKVKGLDRVKMHALYSTTARLPVMKTRVKIRIPDSNERQSILTTATVFPFLQGKYWQRRTTCSVQSNEIHNPVLHDCQTCAGTRRDQLVLWYGEVPGPENQKISKIQNRQ